MAKILIIDHDIGFQRSLGRTLRQGGHEPFVAGDGTQGLQAILTSRPDLVLCAIRLPRMTGYGVLDALRSQHPCLDDLPFVFFSALSSREDIIKGLEAGADDYITKPVDGDLLLARVAARLREAQRNRAKEEREFVKLYTTMARGGPAGPSVAMGDAGPVQRPAAAGAPPCGEDASGTGPESRTIAQMVRQNGGRVVAGRIQTISMDAVRAKVGDQKWERMAGRIRRLAEETIRSKLGPRDLLRPDGDGFVVCFSGLDERDAEIKARLIADEVWERLFGDLQDSELCAVSSEVHTVEIGQDGSEEDLFDQLGERLSQLAERSRSQAAETLRAIYERSPLGLQPVRMASGQAARFALAGFGDAEQTRVERLIEGAGLDDALLADLDVLMLARAAEHMSLRGLEQNRLVVVPLRFVTVGNRQRLARYLQLCDTLVPGVRERLILKVCDVPERIAPTDLSITALSRVSSLRMLELKRPTLGNIDLRRFRIALVSLSYRTALPLAQRSSSFLTRQIHGSGARLLIEQVPPHGLKRIRALIPDLITLQPGAAAAA